MKNEIKISFEKMKGKNEMNFTYTELRKKSASGERIGRWGTMCVYAASAADLDDYGNGAYLVLYDDDNRLVKKSPRGEWHSYGWVDSTGNVHEYDAPRRYKETSVPVEREEKRVEKEEVIADVKIGIDVDKVLKTARELTVDSLLEGFNYGLD